MNAALVRLLWRRAHHCCEYCRMPQAFDNTPFEIDHIIARKHGGPTALFNLALSCFFAIPSRVQISGAWTQEHAS
jgi:5-methylcytosine-specific restriction endonuclease McrA